MSEEVPINYDIEDIPLQPEGGAQLSPEDEAAIRAAYGGSAPEEKHNVHTFLRDVVTTEDTTKLGYLKDEELGTPELPVRTYKELALFCKDVAEMPMFEAYFDEMAEIVNSTSLSRDAKLIELAVITRKEVADVTKKKQTKENKGWFRKKQSE